MRHAIIRGLLAAALLAGAAAPAPAPPPAAAADEAGLYEEGFTSYAAKAATRGLEWDIWGHGLRPELAWSKESQASPEIVLWPDGSSVAVWADARTGATLVYAQRFDADGNRLWQEDLAVTGEGVPYAANSPVVAGDEAGGFVVAWHGSRDDPGVYAQGFDAGGTRRWAADVRVNQAPGGADTGELGIASDAAGNTVIAWDQGPIMAQRLDPAGNRLWPGDVQVGVGANPGWQNSPAAATDPAGNTIIAWFDHRDAGAAVYAQRMSPGGDRLWAADAKVSGASGAAEAGASPAIAVDAGGSIIVWDEPHWGTNHIFAQRLGHDGAPQWGAEVQVDAGEGALTREWPAIAPDQSGGALVAWQARAQPDDRRADLFMQRIDGAGARAWPADLRLNDEGGPVQERALSLASAGGSAIALWIDYRNDQSGAFGDSDLYARRLTVGGERLWPTDLRLNANSARVAQGSPAAAVVEGGDSVVVWVDERGGDPDIYAQRLDPLGNRLWPADVRLNADPGATIQGSPAAASDGAGGVVVAWSDERGGDPDIYAQRLDPLGNRLWPADVRLNSDQGQAAQRDPALGSDERGRAVVVWSDWRDGEPTLYAQRLDAAGGKLWAADVRVPGEAALASSPAYAVDVAPAGEAVVAWNSPTAGGNISLVVAQRLDADGRRLWAADQQVHSSTYRYQGQPDVAIDGDGNAVVVWFTDLSTRTIYQIRAQKLSRSGARLWADDAAVNASAPYLRAAPHPQVSLDGSGNAAVVWGNFYGLPADQGLFAQRLSGAGSRLWESDARVSAAGGVLVQGRPAMVAQPDGGLAVAWQDRRGGNDDVYAQGLTSVGARRWAGDLQVVAPDRFYYPAGTAWSRTIDAIDAPITQATLTAEFQERGGAVSFALSNDGGATWAPVTPGVAHVFTTTGSDLRWRAELAVDPVRLRPPLVSLVRIAYSSTLPYADSYEADDSCGAASPIAALGAPQAHTFHRPGDADWVWFHGTAGTTYVVQTTAVGDLADTVLELHGACGEPPFESDDTSLSAGSVLVFKAPSTGRYYARVRQLNAETYGEGTAYQLAVRAQLPLGAVVIVAGRRNEPDAMQKPIDATADLAYRTFLESGFTKDRILFLDADSSRDPDRNGLADDVDGQPTREQIRDAIQLWAADLVGEGAPFWLYFIDHGKVDHFYARPSETVQADELNLWLSNLEAQSGCEQITVVIEACFSGSFIDRYQQGLAGLGAVAGPNRVVVTSTSSSWDAYAPDWSSPAFFSSGFLGALGHSGGNQDVWASFQAGITQVTAARGPCSGPLCQQPWLDDNGDFAFDQGDGALARARGLGSTLAGAGLPLIDRLEVIPGSAPGQALIRAQVRDDRAVARVWVRIYPPHFQPPPTSDGTLRVLDVPEATLQYTGGDGFEAVYTALPSQPGARVVAYAVDDEGNLSLPRELRLGAGAPVAVYLPLVRR